MGISAPTQSSQYAAAFGTPPSKVDSSDWSSKLRSSYAKLTFTAAGFTTAAAGDIALIRMPAGKVRINRALSRVVCPVGTATADLDVGIGPYIKKDGTTQALQGALLADSLDVGAGAIDTALGTGTTAYTEVESQAGFDIVCSFDTANSPAAGDLTVTVVYQVAN